MPLGPRLLAAEALGALFAVFAKVQPLLHIHAVSPFFKLSTDAYSPKASRTDKELCEDKVALGRAKLFTKQKR